MSSPCVVSGPFANYAAAVATAAAAAQPTVRQIFSQVDLVSVRKEAIAQAGCWKENSLRSTHSSRWICGELSQKFPKAVECQPGGFSGSSQRSTYLAKWLWERVCNEVTTQPGECEKSS